MRFVFTIQRCHADFLEWEIIRLHVKKNVVKYSCCKLEKNSRALSDTVVSGPESFPDLTYTVQMRRRPLFYVFNMILPCFLITIVAFLGFCVPSDSGWLHAGGI